MNGNNGLASMKGGGNVYSSGLLEPQDRNGSGLVMESHRLSEHGLATL